MNEVKNIIDEEKVEKMETARNALELATKEGATPDEIREAWEDAIRENVGTLECLEAIVDAKKQGTLTDNSVCVRQYANAVNSVFYGSHSGYYDYDMGSIDLMLADLVSAKLYAGIEDDLDSYKWAKYLDETEFRSPVDREDTFTAIWYVMDIFGCGEDFEEDCKEVLGEEYKEFSGEDMDEDMDEDMEME